MSATAEPGAAPLPAFAEFVVPSAWRAIEFLSDLHLSASTPRTFEALQTHLRCTRADAVFILGDLFDVWLGDDSRLAGFEAQCTAMLAEASTRRIIGFMPGNRDFLAGDAWLSECGLMRLSDPTVLVGFGERLLISHGDALCLSDVDYQGFRAMVRGASWQRRFLAQTLDSRRDMADEIRDESKRRKSTQHPGDWIDVDNAEAARWLRAARAPELVHGHTHMPATHRLGDALERHVLSDWDLDHLAKPRADVLRWQAGVLERVPPARC